MIDWFCAYARPLSIMAENNVFLSEFNDNRNRVGTHVGIRTR